MHIRKIRNHAISAAATLAITWTAAFSAFAATLSPTTAHDDIPGDATLKEIVEGAGATEALEAEAKERKTADAALQTNVTATATAISDEATSRKDADAALVSSLSDLSDALTAETKSRINGYNSNATAIGNEATARENADKTLQGNIDAVSSGLSTHISTKSGNPHGVTAADVKVSLVATNATGKATVSVGDDSATFYTADEADKKHETLSAAITSLPAVSIANGVVSVDGEKSAALDARGGRGIALGSTTNRSVIAVFDTNTLFAVDGWKFSARQNCFYVDPATDKAAFKTNVYASVLYPDGGRILTDKMIPTDGYPGFEGRVKYASVADTAGIADDAKMARSLVSNDAFDGDNRFIEYTCSAAPLDMDDYDGPRHDTAWRVGWRNWTNNTDFVATSSRLVPDGTDFVTKKTLVETVTADENAGLWDVDNGETVRLYFVWSAIYGDGGWTECEEWGGECDLPDECVGYRSRATSSNDVNLTYLDNLLYWDGTNETVHTATRRPASGRNALGLATAANLSAATNALAEAIAKAEPGDYAAVSNAAMTALQPAATNGLVTASVTNGLASAAALSAHAADTNNPHGVTAAQLGALTDESDPVFAAWTNGASIVAGKGAADPFGGVVIGNGAKGGGVVIGENADSGPGPNVIIGKNTGCGYVHSIVIGSIDYWSDNHRTEAQGNGTFNISTADPAHFWFGAAGVDFDGNPITPRTLQSYLDERATTNDLAATDANVASNAAAISAVSDELGSKAKRYALVASASASIKAADGNLYALTADTNGVSVTLPVATAYVQDFVIRLEPADTNGTFLADIAANPADATVWRYDYPLGTNDVRGVVTEATYFTFTQVTTNRWSIGCYPATKKED